MSLLILVTNCVEIILNSTLRNNWMFSLGLPPPPQHCWHHYLRPEVFIWPLHYHIIHTCHVLSPWLLHSCHGDAPLLLSMISNSIFVSISSPPWLPYLWSKAVLQSCHFFWDWVFSGNQCLNFFFRNLNLNLKKTHFKLWEDSMWRRILGAKFRPV